LTLQSSCNKKVTGCFKIRFMLGWGVSLARNNSSPPAKRVPVKPSKLRQQLALEAARIIREDPCRRYSDARQLAAERLCPGEVRPRDIPVDAEVAVQLQELAKSAAGREWEHRFERYAELLRPLADIVQNPVEHPEGDALYHSLQVFALASDRLPYDEEFLTAALLHDVGMAIDRHDRVAAGLQALEGLVSARTAWLIENLPVAQDLASGVLGVRARRRLNVSEDSEEILILAECDRKGRKRGVLVLDVEDAIEQILRLSQLDECEGSR